MIQPSLGHFPQRLMQSSILSVLPFVHFRVIDPLPSPTLRRADATTRKVFAILQTCYMCAFVS